MSLGREDNGMSADPPTPMPGDGTIDLQSRPSAYKFAIATGLLLLDNVVIDPATYVLVQAQAAGGSPT